MPARTLIAALALVAFAPPAPRAQAPAYFDDFTYARVGTGADAPAADALLGSNRWLVGAGREDMRGWRLGSDDDAHTGPAETYFGGPAGVALVGAGAARRLRLTMGAGFPHDPARYVRPPMVHTAQLFPPGGTFAARVRFSDLEDGQRMIEAFWVFAVDQYRFCPEAEPACDGRTPPPGTLRHADEADFEFNNWFVAEPGSHLHASAVRYREEGASDDPGANSIALACSGPDGIRPLCLDDRERSLLPGRWYVLHFRVDTLAGTVAFEAVEDEPSGAARLATSRRGVDPAGVPPVLRRTRGRTSEPSAPFEFHSPLAVYLSLHYNGYDPGSAPPACLRLADGREATCQAHTLETDWVYQTSRLLTVPDVAREVASWRGRGESRVNTLGVRPMAVDPPLRAPSGDPVQLVLRLDGPRSTARAATWTVRPAHVREIIYAMDVEVRTTCAAGDARCRPRTVRPGAPSFELTPAPGETGMTVRAKLTDPWWGYTHVPSPGSEWREWTVRFTAR